MRSNFLKDNTTSVFKHIEENPSHVIDWDNMKILDAAKDNWRLLLKEMPHINKLKPNLMYKRAQLFSLLIGNKFGEAPKTTES